MIDGNMMIFGCLWYAGCMFYVRKLVYDDLVFNMCVDFMIHVEILTCLWIILSWFDNLIIDFIFLVVSLLYIIIIWVDLGIDTHKLRLICGFEPMC